jgi:uncharacterized cupin superfamily protein
MQIANLFGDDFDDVEEHEGFQIRGRGLGRLIGAELIGGSVYEVDPGKKLWPYHHHHANEEWLVVLRGRPTLRSPEGEHELEEGDVVCFRRGPEGAHQVRNGGDAPVRVLMLSTMLMPELVEYLDSGKAGARDAKGQRVFLSRPGPSLDYWDGES